MYLRLRTVCSMFCVIANYISINSINRLNLISFLVRAERVICKTETKCVYVIYTDVKLQVARITKSKSKGVPRQADVAQGVPGRLKTRIFLTFRQIQGW